MPRIIVHALVVAETIGSALKLLAHDPTDRLGMKMLGGVLRVDEALGVARLVTEQRVRCGRCATAVPVSRASDDLCLGCATANRYELEANQRGA